MLLSSAAHACLTEKDIGNKKDGQGRIILGAGKVEVFHQAFNFGISWGLVSGRCR